MGVQNEGSELAQFGVILNCNDIFASSSFPLAQCHIYIFVLNAATTIGCNFTNQCTKNVHHHQESTSILMGI